MKRLAILLVVLLLPEAARAAEPPDPIHAGYDLLYHGDPAGAYQHFRALADHDPTNLAAAYGVLMSLEAQGLGDAARQAEFEQHADILLTRAESRYGESKRDAEALFYLAQTYAARGAYRFVQDKGIWGAARDAAKSKNYSEEYLRLDPGRADAYFALGLYNYYVDIAPSFIRFLRVFLFLPGGNRAEGLKQIERAAREGDLVAPQARRDLVRIYGWLEGRPEDALRLAKEQVERYPDNPDYNLLLARLYSSPAVEDFNHAAEIFERVVQRAESGHPHFQADTRYQALLGLARVRQQQWRTEDAVALLTATIDTAPQNPEWVLPNCLYVRANYRGLLNDSRAGDDFRRIQAEPKWKAWQKPAQNLQKWMEERRQSGEAARFAELIPGNRLVAERRWDEAAEFYQRLGQQHPDDWQVRFRQASLEFARGNLDGAVSGFDAIISSNPGRMPNWLKAASLLQLARSYDLLGRRPEALKLYQKLVDDYEHESAGQAARVGLITPYRRINLTAAQNDPGQGRK